MMKKILLSLSVIFSGLTAVNAGEIDQTVGPFSTVSVQGNYVVTLIESEEEKVHIVNNDPDVEDYKILVSSEGGTLEVKIKGDTYKERKMEVTIYYKKVYQIDAKRGARVTVNNPLKGDVISFSCATGGQVKATIEATTAKMKISNDGLINVTGTATMAELEVSTGGTLHASQLVTESASAKVTAGGSITVYATKKLSVSVTSGGSISYKGNPETYEESVKIAGTITKLSE